ncbi:MAG TPA: prolyl oligopeptidase family serine peptidase [Bacteroidota bacterium]|nr:prolyl oligopeptidase family serine peptidase [Bacteroidota bacterium]
MNPITTVFRVLIAVAVLFLSAAAQKFQYPVTKKVDQVDTYFGTKVADPYRWLEDETSPERSKWIDEQNKVTFGYLERIPFRAQVKQRLEKLFNYPRYNAPFRKGEYFFFRKNEGLQNQNVLYIQKGIDGSPEVLLDPNKFSADGTTRLGAFTVSKDGKWAAYGISRGGSDWQEYCTMDMSTRKTMPDTLKWVKFSGASWRGNGFYYSRYRVPESGKELTTKNENHMVYYHRVGTPQPQDELVYQDPGSPLRFHFVGTTEDERFAILDISEGSKGKKGNALFYRDESKEEKTFRPIVAEISDDSYNAIDNVGDKFLIQTNKNAPNWRVFLYDPVNPDEKNWNDVLPEKAEPLDGISTAGGKIFAQYLKDVTTRVYIYDIKGEFENEVELPALGTAGGFGGERDEKFVFYTFTSFIYPQAIYRYDLATRRSSVFRTVDIPGFDQSEFETKQVMYNSKDGTRVPMFIVHKKGLKLDGTNPTLLYGYGGFNITTSPSFSSTRLALLEQGFVYASANLRGGGEYGEKWHEAGMKLNKQNVFDDFIAAGEWLIANKYTSSQRLAVQGGSNGGLLVGTVINQRPELFKVALPAVGVMDMLRFHKFTIGYNWISDYGSSESSEAEFKALYAYSPYHNIHESSYPATLITTADHDDRVVPAHSLKYAARIQEMHRGDNPVIIRVETRSGHGASSTTKQIEGLADTYSFLFYNIGVAPKYSTSH